MRRTESTSEHEDFRRMIRDFLAREAVRRFDDWLDAGLVPREFFRALGQLGVIGWLSPEANLLGEEGEAFSYLGRNLPQERLTIAIGAPAAARAALDTTIGYVRDRQVFGKPVSHFQNTKFELAAVATEIDHESIISKSLGS